MHGFLLLVTVLHLSTARARLNTVPIAVGGIFHSHSDDLQTVFSNALHGLNNNHLLFEGVVSTIQNETNHSHIEEELCRQMSRRIAALVTNVPNVPGNPIASDSSTFRLPHISMGRERTFDEYGVNLRPSTLQAVIDIIRHYKWKDILYLHDTEQGMLHYRTIKAVLPNHVTAVYRVSSAAEANEYLQQWLINDLRHPMYVVLNVQATMAQDIIATTKVERFHFLLTSLTSGISKMTNNTGIIQKNGGCLRGTKLKTDIVVTELSFPQPAENRQKTMSVDSALVHDAIAVISQAVKRMDQDHPGVFDEHPLITEATQGLACGAHLVKPFESGKLLLSYFKQSYIQGQTGFVAFDELGFRKDFTLEVIETRRGAQAKIASWSDIGGLQPSRAGRQRRADPRSKTQIVTSILGNDRYEGYCKDLVDLLANMLDFTYTLQIVADGKYGNLSPQGGRWTGMIGEVIRKEADMAIAPLTITSARSQVVDFSSPFMQVGISLMIKKPTSMHGILHQHPLLSAFSAPVWVCIFFSYLAVLVVLYVVARLSPGEYHFQTDRQGNGFCMFVRQFFQTACNLCPRSIGGKIVSHVWWFFLLVISSLYIAHVLALLTSPLANKVVPPISSASDLIKRPDIQYGALLQSSTMSFFRYSKVPLYSKMWEVMNANPETMVSSYAEGVERVKESDGDYVFLMESTKNEYINNRQPCDTMQVGGTLDNKGYGIAVAKNSPLRSQLDASILRLQENGDLVELYRKWWYDRDECPKTTDNESTMLAGVNLRRTAECFYILICGLVVGLVVAGLDYCIYNWMKEKGEKVELATRGSQAKRAKDIVESCKASLIEHCHQLSELQQHLNQQ